MKDWRRQFILIYIGQAFSILGSYAAQFAVIWWLTVTTESAITLSMATIVSFLPNIFMGPFAGVIIDRLNRRTVMMAADALVAVSSIMLAIAFTLSDQPGLWFIYLVLFIRGVGNTFHAPAMQAAIPSLVPKDWLVKAGGWGNMIQSFSNILGPVLGAALIAFMPMPGIMLIDVLGAAIAIGFLSLVRIPDITDTEAAPSGVFSDLRLGFAAIKENRPLMAIFWPMLIMSVIFVPMGTLFPLMVRSHFGGSAWDNSLVELAFAVGLMLSSLIIGVWGSKRKRFLMVSAAFFLMGILTLISGLLPPAAFGVFVVLSFFLGASGTFANVPVMAYIQETIPANRLGKVLALVMAAATLAMPFGLLLAAPLVERIGIATYFFWSGLALIITAVYSRLATRRYDELTLPGHYKTEPE